MSINTEYIGEWKSNPFKLYYEEPAYRALEYRTRCKDKAPAFPVTGQNMGSSLLSVTGVMNTYTSIT